MKKRVEDVLKKHMSKESELLSRFAEKLRMVRQTIIEEDFESLQEQLLNLNNLSTKIEKEEEKRHSVFMKMVKEAHNSIDVLPFSKAISHLQSSEKKILGKLRRDIRAITNKIEIENRTIDLYVKKKNALVQEMINLYVPESRGKIYSKNGQAVSAADRPMLVNTSL